MGFGNEEYIGRLEQENKMLKEKLNNQTYNQYIQKCPVCNGTGLVSRPPGVAGDVETFPTTSAGPWPCRACNGTGIIG